MKEKIYKFQYLFAEHFLLILLLFSLVALTITGIGSREMVGLIGCILCVVALTKDSVFIDPWILFPLLIYEIFSALSSISIFGDVFHGFFNTQIIYPVIYVFLSLLKDSERLWMRRLCAFWAWIISFYGILYFIYFSFEGDISRLEIILGNPNALGCFLVVAWFSLKVSEINIVRRLEPLILTALALTLSMGSFLSMILATIILLIQKARIYNRKELISFALLTIAKNICGISAGIIIYFSVTFANTFWIACLTIIYVFLLSFYWYLMDDFLRKYKKISLLIFASGLFFVIAAIFIRTNAVATFIERFKMMENGLGYILKNPIIGVGPYQWRYLNLYDSDMYFNTWHIHNSLIHIGVELGLVALLMMVIIIIRIYMKGGDGIVGFSAFFFHNMIDVSFFYPCITVLTILTTVGSNKEKYEMGRCSKNIFFLVFFTVFLCTGFHDIF